MQEKNMKIEMRVKAKTKRKIDECKKKCNRKNKRTKLNEISGYRNIKQMSIKNKIEEIIKMKMEAIDKIKLNSKRKTEEVKENEKN